MERYNEVRLHGAIGYVTPKDRLEGRDAAIFAERDRKLEEARARRTEAQARAHMFGRVKGTLRALFHDAGVPRDVRRRVLEASVRAPQDWHVEAIRAAYASEDETWKLTAAFCMRYVRGFDDEIVAMLSSGGDEIRYHAFRAAGAWGVEAAWPHVAAVLEADDPDKDLLLAAIDAAPAIRPAEVSEILGRFTFHDDEDVVDVAFEALTMAGDDDDDEEGPALPPHLLS